MLTAIRCALDQKQGASVSALIICVDNHSSAEFGRYDSLVGAGNFSFGGSFQFRRPADAVSKRQHPNGGDEGKAVGTAQAPAALLSFHNVTIRSVITITEFRVSPF